MHSGRLHHNKRVLQKVNVSLNSLLYNHFPPPSISSSITFHSIPRYFSERYYSKLYCVWVAREIFSIMSTERRKCKEMLFYSRQIPHKLHLHLNLTFSVARWTIYMLIKWKYSLNLMSQEGIYKKKIHRKMQIESNNLKNNKKNLFFPFV